MAEFDNVLAEAQKQVAAINAVLAAHPNILRECRKNTPPNPIRLWLRKRRRMMLGRTP